MHSCRTNVLEPCPASLPSSLASIIEVNSSYVCSYCPAPPRPQAKPTVEELTGDDVLLPEELDMLVTGGLYFALARGLTAAAHQRLSRLTSAPPVGRQVMVLRRSSLLAAYRACCASAPVNHAGRQ